MSKESNKGDGNREENIEDDQCGICLEAVQDGASLQGCSHTFCFECIIRWAHISESPSACPLCRQPFELVRRSLGGELVVVALHDGDARSSSTAHMNSARVVAGRSLRPRKLNSRTEALQRYSRQRAEHLNSVAERLKATRERIQKDRNRRRRNKRSGTFSSSATRASLTNTVMAVSSSSSSSSLPPPSVGMSLEEHEKRNKEAMRLADPSSEAFKTLQRMQRIVEQLKALEADGSDQARPLRLAKRRKRKRNGHRLNKGSN